MSTTFALLGLLEREPSYGYDLKRDYDTLFGKEKPIAFGQVYATLSRMVRDGKIAASQEEMSTEAGGPERKRYAITPRGKAELHTWILQPEPPQHYMQTIFFVKVTLALLHGQKANDFLDAQRAVHLQHMRVLTKKRRGGDLAESLQADYALFHIEADLRWIDLAASRLEQLKKELS